MANQEGKAARAGQPKTGEGVSGPGRGEAERAPRSETPEDAAEVELVLADLICDANGEIVFFNDSEFRTATIRTDVATVAEGRVGRYVTAAGTDVTGYKFVTFDNGVTLYYNSALALSVQPEDREPGDDDGA